MDDQTQIRQIDARAPRHRWRHKRGRAVAQRLKRMVALALAEFAGQRHGREAALEQDGFQVAHRLRVAQNTSASGGSMKRSRLTMALSILLCAMRMARYSISAWPSAAPNVLMRSASRLIVLRQIDDGLGQGCGEQERAPRRGRGLQDELQVFAKAHVEHLVGFVEHDGFQRRNIQRPAFQMIAQASGRADDDMHAVRSWRRSRPGSMPPTQATMRAPA